MALDVALHFSKLDICAQSNIDQSPNTFYQFRFDKNQNSNAAKGAILKRSTSASAIDILVKMVNTIEKEKDMAIEKERKMQMEKEMKTEKDRVKEEEKDTEKDEKKSELCIMYNNRNILDLSYLCPEKTHLYDYAILDPKCDLYKNYNKKSDIFVPQQSIEKKVFSSCWNELELPEN